MQTKYMLSGIVLSALVVFSGCTDKKSDGDTQTKKEGKSQINMVISISQRKVHVLRDNDTLRSYPIAVGTSEYPTPKGEFKIHQIDFNPDWNPPDSEWSKDESFTPPAHPENPMGKARIIYQMPYTLHGTKDLESLGEAESHGSVRMANTDVIDLAKFIMAEAGNEKPEEWYAKVLLDSTKMVSVKLNDSIPLVNKQ